MWIMTIAQIFAVLALLQAFHVPQPTLNTVRAILLPTTPVAPISASLEAVGGVGSPVLDCTPILEASATDYQGGYMLNATSTYPVSCEIDRSTPVTFNTSLTIYKGTIGAWAEGYHGEVKGNQFIYHQGFGVDKHPATLIWTVGSTSTTTTI